MLVFGYHRYLTGMKGKLQGGRATIAYAIDLAGKTTNRTIFFCILNYIILFFLLHSQLHHVSLQKCSLIYIMMNQEGRRGPYTWQTQRMSLLFDFSKRTLLRTIILYHITNSSQSDNFHGHGLHVGSQLSSQFPLFHGISQCS